MQIKLHQDMFGRRSGETIEVDGTEGTWALTQGYASKPDGSDEDMHLATDVDAEGDPTLAANREAAGDNDAAAAEDEATNSEAAKRADVEAAKPVREAPSTAKRPRSARATNTATVSEPSEG